MQTLIRPPFLAVFALVLTATVALVLLTTAGLASPDSQSTPSTKPVDPETQLRDTVVRLRSEQFINYDLSPRDSLPAAIKERQARQLTDSWQRIDSNGIVVEYRNVTTTPGGTVVQDQYFDGTVLHINHYGWLDFGQACGETATPTRAGGLLPRAGRDALLAAGYVPHDLPPEALDYGISPERAYAVAVAGPAIESEGFASRLLVEVFDRDTGHLLGYVSYGVGPDGERTVREWSMHTLEPAGRDDVPSADFAPLPPCVIDLPEVGDGTNGGEAAASGAAASPPGRAALPGVEVEVVGEERVRVGA